MEYLPRIHFKLQRGNSFRVLYRLAPLDATLAPLCFLRKPMVKPALIGIIFSLVSLAISAQAQIGWTLDQCRDAWGSPLYKHSGYPDGEVVEFRPKQRIYVHFSEDGKVNSVMFWNTAGADNFAKTSPLESDDIQKILDQSKGPYTWDQKQDDKIDQVSKRPAWVARDSENNIKLVAFLDQEDKSGLVIRTYDQFVISQQNEKKEAEDAKDGGVSVGTYSDFKDEESEAARFHSNYRDAILSLFKSYLPDPDSIVIQEIVPPEDRKIKNRLYVVTKARISFKTPQGRRASNVWGIVFDPADGDVASLDESTFRRFLSTGDRRLLPKGLTIDDDDTQREIPERTGGIDHDSTFIVKIIHALDNRNSDLVTSYTVDGATDYFGHRGVTNRFIRNDIEGDAQTYRWSRSYPDESTFHRSVSGDTVYESIEETTESLENSGRLHRAHCLFQLSYKEGNSPRIYAFSLKVLR